MQVPLRAHVERDECHSLEQFEERWELGGDLWGLWVVSWIAAEAIPNFNLLLGLIASLSRFSYKRR